MPEAIETSRRRFFKALDSLSSTHSASPSTTSSTTSNKRNSTAAFEEARERVRKRLRQSTSSTSLSQADGNASVISLPRPPIAKNKDIARRPPPNFSPWSQETFLARLKTFSSVSLWHPKPAPISEVEWAKRGWMCVGVNTVACRGGCEKRVVISIDSPKESVGTDNNGNEDEDEDDGSALEEALSERYKAVIVDGHSSSCLWHKTGCKDDIYRLPVVRPSIWQPDLRKRFQSLVGIQDAIKDIKIRQVESSNTSLMSQLPKDILGPDSPADDTAHRPFELAMHGWRGSSESGTELLHCDACFQRVGLWMYQPDHLQKQARDQEEEPDDDAGVVDPMEMHREHCPWRNPASQNATGSLSGLNACQVLQRVVATAARDYRRRSNMHAEQPTAELELDDAIVEVPVVQSRDEIARQDKERESRLRKLKNLFHIKRRPTTKT